MYLTKIEIKGFKSFLTKTILFFPRPNLKNQGITAIVGPNGSGKSNIADAVRWVLGEQSIKHLRGKKGEDVIFNGSIKKGKLSMAEVSLFLDNQENFSKKSHQEKEIKSKSDFIQNLDPYNFSEIILTRRIYRDGQNEYLINNNRVRLADIQIFLAKANFGQKTYSVIGQGMVDNFLHGSSAQKKEFFDEATGVKQFQIKRDDSLNKLRKSYENITQVEMLLKEIEPRLKSLTRQVKKLEKRETVERDLKEIRIRYYGDLFFDLNQKFNQANQEFLNLEKTKLSRDQKLEILNSDLEKLLKNREENNEYKEYQSELKNFENLKDYLVGQLARLNAQLESRLEKEGKFDLAFFTNKKEEIKKNLDINSDDIDKLKKELEEFKVEKEIQEKNNINSKIDKLNQELQKKKELEKKIGNIKIDDDLKRYLEKMEDIKNETDIFKIKKIIEEIKEDFKETLKKVTGEVEKEKIKQIQSQIIVFSQEKEIITKKINDKNLKRSSLNERLNLLVEKNKQFQNELQNIENKLKKDENSDDYFRQIEIEKEKLNQKLKKLEEERKEIQTKVDNLSEKEEERTREIIRVQKNIQEFQKDLNNLNNQLNDLKIKSTRFETKLEDLEREIRSVLGGLEDVQKFSKDNYNDDFSREELSQKIYNLKKQLELIGGIDPEVEKEYKETKERYDFLSGQTSDLSKTIRSLEKIIRELDVQIKDQFEREFKIISKKFDEYFKILFDGGRAEILKISQEEGDQKNNFLDKENNIDKDQKDSDVDIQLNADKLKFLKKHNATGLSGIEIKASPPNKKIISISMLSGGERALTAIALICAIISTNPSPFVFLDEVDAALDEANSFRLANILEELAHKTQFIVITHNRASMQKANFLYGVTMGEDGVSNLVSVKLEEAEKSAAR